MTASRELTHAIAGAARQDIEGGTVALNGLPLPSAGYYVGGAGPSLVFDSFAVVDGPEIARFVESAPSAYVGWWVDSETGKIYIDAVEWYANEFTATAIAQVRHELAVWDIAGERELRLGYEGE